MNFKDFINQNINRNPQELRLAYSKKDWDFDVNLAIDQIECRRKNDKKLSQYISSENFIFPDTISAQQASHQAIAAYHASLVPENSSILDITAGLGIDTFAFANKSKKVSSIELNPGKAHTLKENINALGFKNIEVINGDSIDYLKNASNNFDLIFADPSRRDNYHNKVYNLHDCSPDVINNQQLLLEKAPRVLIKASPLLDIKQIMRDFRSISSIKTVGVNGECKEVLIELDKSVANEKDIKLEAINLDSAGNIESKFSTDHRENETGTNNALNYCSISDIKRGSYLLEPSAMIMKIAPWDKLGSEFNAKKLSAASHLFVSEVCPQNFPGRVTRIEKFIKKEDRKSLYGFPASAVSKNYPLSSEELRKVLKLKEGDNFFVYGTKIASKPHLLLTKKI